MASATTTVPGAASTCRRAARLGVSPTTPRSCAAPSPIRSPTTTSRWQCRPAPATVPAPPAQQPHRPAPARPSPRARRCPRVPRDAEIDQHAVAHVFGNKPGRPCRGVRNGAVIGADDVAQILRVEPRRKRRRTDQVAEHVGELAAFRPTDGARRSDAAGVGDGAPDPASSAIALRACGDRRQRKRQFHADHQRLASARPSDPPRLR